MRTFHLPERPERLDLAALNKSLHAGEICLDWSNVKFALSSAQMATLLSGLHLTAHGEILGFNTVPLFLQERMVAILRDQEIQHMRQEAEKKENPRGAIPTQWLPEGERSDSDITMIKRKLAYQDEAELVLPGKSLPLSALPPEHRSLAQPASTDTPVIDLLAQKKMQAGSVLSSLVLDMQVLATADVTNLPVRLQPLISAYQAWIDEQDARLQKQTDNLENRENELNMILQQCRKTLAGIQAGLALLKDNREAFQAFSFMNRAMWLQRIHLLYAAQKPYNSTLLPGDVDLLKNRCWQPFQLAFILLNLPSLTVSQNESREEDASSLAEQLWFPPGDGKAEARLALAAYALGLQRLEGNQKSVEERQIVVLRYTARLFPSQQFQSVATLICACEMIRHGNRTFWGGIPFRLGLWTAPHSATNGEVLQSRLHPPASDSTSFIFARLLPICPWCGNPVQAGKSIEVESYRGKKRVRRTLLYCRDPSDQCSFSKKQSYNEGLPVLVADEGIDRLFPSLLIATTDKSVQLPWSSITQLLFE